MSSKLQVGDLIKCSDPEQMIEQMYSLLEEGIETDFVYEHNQEKGYWLEITSVEGRK